MLLNSCVRKALLSELIDKNKAIFETEAPWFFAEDSLTRFMVENTEAFTILIKRLATTVSLQDILHPNSVEIAKVIQKGAAELLKNEDHNSNFLYFIKV